MCLNYVNCHNGFFNGIRCNGGRYCTKWGGGGKVCRKYVSCRNGFFNGINCHGTRYCVSWGLLQEGEEVAAKDSESQNADADSTHTELDMQTENDLQNENEENQGNCLSWARCRNGFFNGIRCSGGRYCTRWGGGGVGGRRRWGGGGRVCKKYVSCRNGFFNGINCHGSRHCVTWGLLQEGEEVAAKDSESQNADVDSTHTELDMQTENDLQNENEENQGNCLSWARCRNGFFNGIRCSGGRYCTRWGGGGVGGRRRWGGGGRVCKKYVSCRNGFFNGINCHGSRHCVTWGLLQEGEEVAAKDSESQNADVDSTHTELDMQTENDLQNENEENQGNCLSWARCRNGFFNGIRCSGGRYCTRWGGGGYGGRRRWRSGGRVCKRYVSCRKGFWHGIRCNGSRHCVTWGLLQEGEEEAAKESTQNVEDSQSETQKAGSN